MMRYLKFPKRAPDYREGKAHDEFVTSLKKGLRLNSKPSKKHFQARLADAATLTNLDYSLSLHE